MQIRDRIAQKVGPQRFKIWFKNSTRFSCADGFVKVGVPNVFIGGWIENHFSDAITDAAKDVLGHDVQVAYSIDPDLFRNLRKTQLNSQAAFIEKNAERVIREKKAAPAAPPPRKLRGTLDTFIVGSTNQLAYSVAREVVNKPTSDTAPIFFHGGCGLGKTHLLQGIANALAAEKPEIRWVYSTGEEFTNQFLFALRERRLDAFRHKFRDVNVLLLDDVHFLANKKATQEEFLHTFNALHTAGMRVVMASDVHPRLIGDLSESLVNRMMSGMIVRIERPDFQTRCEILRRRTAGTHQHVPDTVISYIAERGQSNVRELEGCLLKLLAYAALTGAPITPAMARQALEDHLNRTGKILTVSDIELSVATFFGLTPADLHSSRKSRTVALARNIAMHIARTRTDLSFPEIGRMMGNKNHTTVLLACRRIAKGLADDVESTWQTAGGMQSARLRDLVSRLDEALKR
jgi:chromosomal replication initiator protein